MEKYISVLMLLLILLFSCIRGEKWSGTYCNDNSECKQFAGWIGYELDSCPKILVFDHNTAEQYVSVREIYYLQNGTCVE